MCLCGCKRRWEFSPDVGCVSCPDCGLLYFADPIKLYVCPACGHGRRTIDEPANDRTGNAGIASHSE